MAAVELGPRASGVLRDMPKEIAERYAAFILAIGADPYGTGRAVGEDPDVRVADAVDGWLLYTVRPGEEPGVYLTDIGYVGHAD